MEFPRSLPEAQKEVETNKTMEIIERQQTKK